MATSRDPVEAQIDASQFGAHSDGERDRIDIRVSIDREAAKQMTDQELGENVIRAVRVAFARRGGAS